MKKVFSLTAVCAMALTVVSCGNKTAVSDTDSVRTDTASDEVVVDSASLTTDTVAASAVEPASASEKSPGSDNTAKIDKLLKDYGSIVSDIRDNLYEDGKFTPGTMLRDFLPVLLDTKDQLTALEGEMTPEQKAKFDKLTNSIKEVF